MKHFFSRNEIGLVLLLVLVFLSGPGFDAQPVIGAESENLPTEATVREVIDGDTIRIDGGRMVRYGGINAPETRVREGRRWKARPQIFAAEARAFNQRCVAGKRIQLEYDQVKRDQYRRLLAYVRVGSLLINEALIKEGLALADIRIPNLKYQKRFLDLQEEARAARRGLWGAIGDHTIPAEEAAKHIGELGAVRGRIIRVYYGKEKVFLDFGRDFRKDFRGIVFRENLTNFSGKTRTFIEDLSGSDVRIMGSIKKMGVPAIIISAPSQVEILSPPTSASPKVYRRLDDVTSAFGPR